FRDRVAVVAMDGFTGYRTAAETELPQAVTVMDPFHVVHLAADKLTMCRQRIQQATCGHRGRKGDPLYGIRRLVLTRPGLLTDKQQTRLDAGLAADEMHIAVDVTRQVYVQLIDAYQQPNRATGKKMMLAVLEKIHAGLPPGLGELAQLGRTLWRKRAQVLAYFDTDASNGPVEAINGRLEHLRGIALGFRNLDHYTLRSLLHSGQLADRINAL
ncbi:transposase, partial [Tsukamurella spumae]|uniref:transposase n=1 Tax=Tsukamurella spumae TaxID=44753 RepID=UPI0031CDECA3